MVLIHCILCIDFTFYMHLLLNFLFFASYSIYFLIRISFFASSSIYLVTCKCISFYEYNFTHLIQCITSSFTTTQLYRYMALPLYHFSALRLYRFARSLLCLSFQFNQWECCKCVSKNTQGRVQKIQNPDLIFLGKVEFCTDQLDPTQVGSDLIKGRTTHPPHHP